MDLISPWSVFLFPPSFPTQAPKEASLPGGGADVRAIQSHLSFSTGNFLLQYCVQITRLTRPGLLLWPLKAC